MLEDEIKRTAGRQIRLQILLALLANYTETPRGGIDTTLGAFRNLQRDVNDLTDFVLTGEIK